MKKYGVMMKNHVLVKPIAILSCLYLPFTAMADSNTLYGDFRYSINQIDDDAGSQFSGENNSSIIGLKGEYGEDGLKAFYNFQTGVNIDGDGDTFTKRFYYAGIEGSFGKVIYGRGTSTYKKPGLMMDKFYDTAAGLSFGGATYGLSKFNNGWTDNSLMYYSPKMNGFTASAGVYIDDTDANEHDTTFGLVYADDAFDIGVQYMNVGDSAVIAKSSPDTQAFRIHSTYKNGPWTLSGSYENIEVNNSGDQQYIYLLASYQMSKKLKLQGGFGSVQDASPDKDGNGIHLGAFYQLLKKTSVYMVFSTVGFDKSGKDDRNVFSLGVSHKFAFSDK